MKNLLAQVKGFSSYVRNAVKTFAENETGDIGIGTILGVVLLVVVFAFIVMPETRSLVDSMFTNLSNWFDGLNIFPTS